MRSPRGRWIRPPASSCARRAARRSAMSRSHRRLVGVALAAAVGLGSWVSAQPAPGSGPAWSLPARPVTITYWDSAESIKNELVKKLIPEYQKLHPNVTVKYEIVADLLSKLLVALSTGTAPDMFSVPDWFLP